MYVDYLQENIKAFQIWPGGEREREIIFMEKKYVHGFPDWRNIYLTQVIKIWTIYYTEWKSLFNRNNLPG